MNQLVSALSLAKGKKSIILVGNHKDEGLTGITAQIKNSFELKNNNRDVIRGGLKDVVKRGLKLNNLNAVVVTFESSLEDNKTEVKAMQRLCKIEKYQIFKINLV